LSIILTNQKFDTQKFSTLPLSGTLKGSGKKLSH